MLIKNPYVTPKSFTLIEMLVVIAIIGILASILAPVLVKARNSALDLSCSNNMRNITTGGSLYSNDNDDQIVPSESQASTDFRYTWFCLLAGNPTAAADYEPPYGLRYSINAQSDRSQSSFVCPREERDIAWAYPFGYTHYAIGRVAGRYDGLGNGWASTPAPMHRMSQVFSPSKCIFFAEPQALGIGGGRGCPMATDVRPSVLNYRHGNGGIDNITIEDLGTTNIAYIDGHVKAKITSELRDSPKPPEATTASAEKDAFRYGYSNLGY